MSDVSQLCATLELERRCLRSSRTPRQPPSGSARVEVQEQDSNARGKTLRSLCSPHDQSRRLIEPSQLATQVVEANSRRRSRSRLRSESRARCSSDVWRQRRPGRRRARSSRGRQQGKAFKSLAFSRVNSQSLSCFPVATSWTADHFL